VDELYLWIFPLVLGKGKRLFGDGAVPAGLQLTESKTSSTGVVIATYRRSGEVTPGSFALEQPTAAEIERRRRLAGSAPHWGTSTSVFGARSLTMAPPSTPSASVPMARASPFTTTSMSPTVG
jgi:hypothetical protein